MVDQPIAGESGGMKVIGAGFGRTGTLSLKTALEELGFAPCYHMVEVFNNPDDVDQWEAASRGEPVDWEAFWRAIKRPWTGRGVRSIKNLCWYTLRQRCC